MSQRSSEEGLAESSFRKGFGLDRSFTTSTMKSTCGPLPFGERMTLSPDAPRLSTTGSTTGDPLRDRSHSITSIADADIAHLSALAASRERAARGPLRRFADRGFLFEHDSRGMQVWRTLLTAAIAYTAVYTPLALTFPLAAHWRGAATFDALLDTLYFLDVFVRLRTSIVARGRVILDGRIIARHYASSWLLFDLVSSCFPIGAVVAAYEPSTRPRASPSGAFEMCGGR
jgi:hypothetical protein